jgi:hypothetical protein
MGIEPRLIDLLVQIAWRGRGGSALHQSKPGRIHDGAIRVGFCAEQCIDTGLRIQLITSPGLWVPSTWEMEFQSVFRLF